MSTASIQLRALLRHRGLIFWTFLVPALFYVPITAVFMAKGLVHGAFVLTMLLTLAFSTGFFLASGQMEMLSRATFFLMPRLVGGMSRIQLWVGAAVAGFGFAAALVLPGLRQTTAGDVGPALAVAALAVLAYALAMLLVYLFAHTPWVPFMVLWIQLVLIRRIIEVPDAQLASLLGQAPLLLAGAFLVVFLIGEQLRSRSLHRRVAEQPFLSVADMKNQGRVTEFKRLRNLHKVDIASGPRPFAGFLQRGMRLSARLRREGRHPWALAWEAVTLTFATSLARHWWKLALAIAIAPVFLIVGGYFDAWSVARGKDFFVAWFVNIPFMGVTYFGVYGTYLRHPAPGRLWDRTTRNRALWPTMMLMLGSSYAVTAILYVYGQLAATFLPAITVQGMEIRMIPPSWHVWAWPVFCHATQMVVWALWRSPRSLNVMQQTGTAIYFFFMLFLMMWYPPFAYPAAVVVTVLLLMTLPLLWSWRVERTDQA